MDKVNAKDVDLLARKSRVKLTDVEKRALMGDLDILGKYTKGVQEAPTEGVEPTHTPIKQSNVLREDEPGESLPVAVALANSMYTEDEQFVVPPVASADTERATKPVEEVDAPLLNP